MKVLLRNTQTGLFYAGRDQWTPEHDHARDFETPASALQEVSIFSLAGVELICHFENPVFDLPLTIHGTGG